MPSALATPRRSPSPAGPLHDPPPSGQAEAAEAWLSSSLPREGPTTNDAQKSPLPPRARQRITDRSYEPPADGALPPVFATSQSSQPDLTRSKQKDVFPLEKSLETLIGPSPSFLSVPSDSEPEESSRPKASNDGAWQVVEHKDGISFIQPRPRRRRSAGQKKTPSHISSVNAEPSPRKKPRLDARMSQASGHSKSESDPTLSEEQQNLVNTIMSGKNVFYTGSAGCGKSTVLKAAVKQLREQGLAVCITAPTGRAALQVEGTSTWSFMGWTPDDEKKKLEDLKRGVWRETVKHRLQCVDVLIIDEISMVENHFFERINICMKEVREYKVKESSRRAFGGVQLIVTGDFYQLPPTSPFQFCIVCGAPTKATEGGTVFHCSNLEDDHGPWLEHTKWAFLSKAWEECNFKHVELREIHRQADPEFIRILQKCRTGDELTLDETDMLMDHPCNVDDATNIYPVNREVDNHNAKRFNELPTPEVAYGCLDNFTMVGKHKRHKDYQRQLPDGSLKANKNHKLDTEVKLKKDMLVVLQINLDLHSGLCNGSQGIIVGFEKHRPRNLPEASKTSEDDQNDKKKKVRSSVGNVLLESTEGRQPESNSGFLGSPEVRGDYAIYRREQIRLFAEQQRHQAPLIWPVVKFHNGKTRTIYPDCIVSSACYAEPYCLLSRTQVPLMAGWAMSIHKSQGMTLNRVRVNLSNAFLEGQVYVALSRATSLDGLKIDGSRGGLDVGLGGNEQVKEFLEKHGLLKSKFSKKLDESGLENMSPMETEPKGTDSKQATPNGSEPDEFGLEDVDFDGIDLDKLESEFP